MKIYTAFTVFAVVLVGGVILVTRGPGEQKPFVVSESDAVVVCEDFVRDALRSPASAKFSPRLEIKATHIAGDTWNVRSWVDAQNGFGAVIRNDYDCQATFTQKVGEKLYWQRDSVTVTPR